jgi:hypothetical protein
VSCNPHRLDTPRTARRRLAAYGVQLIRLDRRTYKIDLPCLPGALRDLFPDTLILSGALHDIYGLAISYLDPIPDWDED